MLPDHLGDGALRHAQRDGAAGQYLRSRQLPLLRPAPVLQPALRAGIHPRLAALGSLGLTRHSELGTGYDLRIGLAGSVFGADHLALSGGLAKSGLQTGGLVRELQITYRIHY